MGVDIRTCLASALAALATTANAQPASIPARLASDPMSRQELLACVEREEQVKARRASLELRTAGLNDESESLSVEAKWIDDAQRAQKPGDKAAREQLARRIEAYNRRIAADNLDAKSLTQDGAGLEADIGAFNAACATRPFDPKDQESARAEYRARVGQARPVVAPAAAAAGPFEEGVKAHDQGRYEAAFALWLPLAEQGRAAAQFNLGALFEKGQGVARDDVSAAQWYLKAAEQGDTEAQYKVAAFYETGTGVPVSVPRARFWYGRVVANAGTDSASLDAARRAREQLARLPKGATHENEEVMAYDGGRFVIARSAAKDCVIALQGMVNRGATLMFEGVVKKATSLGCSSPLTLVLESLGGSHDDGIRLGRMVRAEGLRTVARYECASACATIFLGGVQRVLWGSRAAIGLHQVALQSERGSTSDRRCSQSIDGPGVVEMRRYLRFSIPASADRVFRVIMDTSCDSIEWISGQRAVDLGLATEVKAESADVFGPMKLR